MINMGIFNTKLAHYLELLGQGNKLFFQETYTPDGFGDSVPVSLRTGQNERLSNDKRPLFSTIYVFWIDGNNGKLYCETCSFMGDSPDEFDEKSVSDSQIALYFLFCISVKPIVEIKMKRTSDSKNIDAKAMALGLKYLTYLLKSVNEIVPRTTEGGVCIHDINNILSNIDISYESFKEEHSNDTLDMEFIINELKQVADYRRDEITRTLGVKMDSIRPSKADLEAEKLQYNGTDDYKYVGSTSGKGSFGCH